MSVKELARLSDLAPTTIYDLEAGRQRSTTKLHRIADALGKSAVELEHGPRSSIRESAGGYDSHRRSQRLSRVIDRLDEAERTGHLSNALFGIIEQALELLGPATGGKR